MPLREGAWLREKDTDLWVGGSAIHCSVDLGRFPYIFVPQFPHWHNEDDTVFGLTMGIRGPCEATPGFPCGSSVKDLPAVQELQEMWVRSLSQEVPLEEGMATHSGILPWRISWTEKPGVFWSIGSQSRTRLK